MDLTIQNKEVTISSLEIAERTNKAHKHILADVRKMCSELNFDLAEITAEYNDASGKQNLCYMLPKDLAVTLVSGYSIPLRHAIIKRLDELEKQQAPKSSNPLELFRLTLETLESQNAQLQIVNQKIEKLEHSTTLDHAQQQTLQKHVSIRVAELIALHNLPEGTKHGLFASIYGNLKEKYKVPSYRDIPKLRFDEAVNDVRKTELKVGV